MWEFSGLACRHMSKSETLGEPLKNETPPGALGEPLKNESPQTRWANHWKTSRRVGRTIEKRPGALGEPLKNESPQTRWANH